MKAKLVEIVKVRHYKRPKKLVCIQCDNCLKVPLMYCLVDRIKMFPCFNDKRLSCKKCNYGDTKEQLVLKITQVLRTKRALFGITDKQLAEQILEFLGVK